MLGIYDLLTLFNFTFTLSTMPVSTGFLLNVSFLPRCQVLIEAKLVLYLGILIDMLQSLGSFLWQKK